MSFADTLAGDLLVSADDLAEAGRLSALAAVPGETGALATLELYRLVGEAAVPDAALRALDQADAGDAAMLLGMLVVHAFAALRVDYRAQPDAAAARRVLLARAEAAYPAIGDAFGHDALDFAVRLVGAAALDLSRHAASLAPLVRVETALSLPSSLLAWDLYDDPARGEEIVERSRAATPMLMPIAFQALAV